MNNFKKKALCAAIGATLMVPATSLMAAEVGNFFHTEGKSKLQIGVFYNNSKRDVEQKGRANLLSESYFEDISPTETATEETQFSINGLDAEQETQDLYLKISYALTPKIEVYGKLGASTTDLDIDRDSGSLSEITTETFTENGGINLTESFGISENTGGLPSEAFSTHQDSDTGWLAGVGTKVTIHETASGWNLGIDGQYVYREQNVGESFFGGGDWELDDHESHELQASLILGKVIGNFRPYGGISYTKFESEYDIKFTDGTPPSYVNASGTLEFENKDNVGYFAGFDFDFSGLTASFEARGGDEQAVTIGIRMPL
jgi:hypothetical protein